MPPDLQAFLENAATAQAMALIATGERLFALDASRLGAGAGKASDVAAPSSIALLRLHGTVTPRGTSGMEGFRARLASARDNPEVGAAIIDTDSPGGTVAGSAEAAHAVADLAAVKPVIAFVDTLAASAAYWIASQASQIWMTPSGEVGSIGIRAMHADISKMLGDMGVNITEVASARQPAQDRDEPVRSALRRRAGAPAGARGRGAPELHPDRGGRPQGQRGSRAQRLRQGAHRRRSAGGAARHGRPDRHAGRGDRQPADQGGHRAPAHRPGVRLMGALTDEQRQQLREGAAAVAAGAPPPPVIVIERRRLVEPRLVSPAEAEALFRERVIELG